jgi:hypothetical protein
VVEKIKLNNEPNKKFGTLRTSYKRNDFLSSSSEWLTTNLTLVETPRNANTTMANIGGRQSNMSPQVIANIITSNDQRAMLCRRIIGIVFRPMAASPERSLKSCACPYRMLYSDSGCASGITLTVSVNIRPLESMAVMDLLLKGC